MIKKSIMLDIKSPYLNSVVEPARLVTLKVIVSRLPAGKNNPMNGHLQKLPIWMLLDHYKSNCNTYYTECLEEVKELLG
jgi:hypothetical protein